MNPNPNPNPNLGPGRSARTSRRQRRAARRWANTLAALAEAGGGAGGDSAAWWQQDTIGGRASGDAATVAGRVLAGLHDLDPLVLDALPTVHLDDQLLHEMYQAHAGRGAPTRRRLSPGQRVQAVDTFRDAHDTAVAQQVAAYCHTLLHPDPDPDVADLDVRGRPAGR